MSCEAALDLLLARNREEAVAMLQAIAVGGDAANGSSSPAPAAGRDARTAAGAILRLLGVEQAPRSPTPVPGSLAHLVGVIDSASRALREGRVAELVEGACAVDAAVEDAHPWLQLRAASLMQAAFRFTADPEVLDAAITSCTRVGDRVDAPNAAIVGRALLASVHMMAGRLDAAMERADAALELAATRGRADGAEAALAHQFRGYLLWEWGRAEEAEMELRRAWERTTEREAGVRSGVARVMATLTAAEGRAEESDRWMEELEALVREPMTLRNREWLAAVRLTRAVLLRRSGAAPPRGPVLREIERWRRSWAYEVDDVVGWSVEHLRSRLHELSNALTLLELTRQWTGALALAGLVLDRVGPVRVGFQLHAATARAVALEGLGRSAEADDAWSTALSIGVPRGYVRSFYDGSELRLRLQRRAVQRPETVELAKEIAAAAGRPHEESATRALTPRQGQVLERLALGERNRAAAAALGVSEATLKTHVREILRRLGAESRTHAVAIARQRGLL